MTPEQYVQQKAVSSGSSFYYAFLFLPKERRAAITAFYAFCREVDDVVAPDPRHVRGVVLVAPRLLAGHAVRADRAVRQRSSR